MVKGSQSKAKASQPHSTSVASVEGPWYKVLKKVMPALEIPTYIQRVEHNLRTYKAQVIKTDAMWNDVGPVHLETRSIEADSVWDNIDLAPSRNPTTSLRPISEDPTMPIKPTFSVNMVSITPLLISSDTQIEAARPRQTMLLRVVKWRSLINRPPNQE